jgi:UDP-N-acetylmuramoyl-L-alanyl-D-glutamate--2,6-diaminopimelate ligase
VPGRLESVPGKRNFQVYVDYAHTPDAFENVLKTIRQLQPARVITVFGCGGDRDRSKRPQMASIAEKLSDKVIVTSDNPRQEDPMGILHDISKGFRGNYHEVFLDRESAIRRAIEIAAPRDIVLIAGKGHEKYQETRSGLQPFSDLMVAARAIAAKPVEGFQ